MLLFFVVLILCSNGDLVYQSNLEDPRKFDATKCNVNERFAILLHGWRESCNVTWMKQLINSELLKSKIEFPKNRKN